MNLSVPLPLRSLHALVRVLPFRRLTAHADPDERRDFEMLASGLRAVLARHPQKVVRRDFAASSGALRSLRRQLLLPLVPVDLHAATLNDLAHEIALHADADTRAAAARCLRRAVAGRRRSAQT